MRERRFLAPDIARAAEIEIRGEEAHHLLHVLRLREGDEIIVFDGDGRHYRAVITRCGRESADVRKLGPLPSNESPLDLWVAVAIPKGDKMAVIIRMLTELGVHRLLPLVSERSVVHSIFTSRKKLPRWKRIAVEACKQSGRSRAAQLEEPLLFGGLLEKELPSDRFLVCPGGDSLPRAPRSRSCLIVVGPEGGWTRDEMARAQQRGFGTLGLGNRILRTETAAVTTTAMVQDRWGDLSTAKR